VIFTPLNVLKRQINQILRGATHSQGARYPPIFHWTAIAPLRFWGPKTDEHCRFDVFQIRKTELGLRPMCNSLRVFLLIMPPPRVGLGDGMKSRLFQALDTPPKAAYEIVKEAGGRD
jgi:hypothetical protein